jgi:hypothetical protein
MRWHHSRDVLSVTVRRLPNEEGKFRLAAVFARPVRENQSRRDLTKVAQYEVLGNDAKNRSVPPGTIENSRLLVPCGAQRLQAFVDRPVRDGLLFKNANPALRTGLLSLSPSGTKVLTVQSLPQVDAHGQPPDEVGNASLPDQATPDDRLSAIGYFPLTA